MGIVGVRYDKRSTVLVAAKVIKRFADATMVEYAAKNQELVPNYLIEFDSPKWLENEYYAMTKGD